MSETQTFFYNSHIESGYCRLHTFEVMTRSKFAYITLVCLADDEGMKVGNLQHLKKVNEKRASIGAATSAAMRDKRSKTTPILRPNGS